MTMLMFSLAVTAVAGWLILRKASPQIVLLAAALALMSAAQLTGTCGILKQPTGGGPLLDFFTYVGGLLGERTAGLGMMIMSIFGFGAYMDSIGASKVLVKIITGPLGRVRSVYALLMFASLAGIVLNAAIISASGLGVLLGVTLMPVMIAMGASPGAAAAVVVTSGCLDFGPAQPNVLISANLLGITPAAYFLKYQLPAALLTGAAVAVFHVFYQRRCDRLEGFSPAAAPAGGGKSAEDLPPPVYAALPLLPVLLLLVFSPLFDAPVTVGIVPAMLVSAAAGMAFEFARQRRVRPVLAGLEIFFFGMGRSFATVVTLIVAAEAFGAGLKNTGAIDALLQGVFGLGEGAGFMAFVLLLVIAAAAMLTGSGNAAFFTFADMLPGIAAAMGVPLAAVLVPVQMASGLGRTMSPVAAVVIAAAGLAGIPALSLVRRTIPPMLLGLAVSFLAGSLLVR